MKSKPRIQPPLYLNIANWVSLSRLILLPAFFYFLYYYVEWRRRGEDWGILGPTYYLIALGLVALILLTDYLDGWLARRLQLMNPLGAFLDPLADKFFAFLAISLLAWADQLPAWLAMVVFFKELFQLIGWLLLFILGYNAEVDPCMTGKVATGCQGAVVVAALLTLPGHDILGIPGIPLYQLADILNRVWFHILTAALTTLAGAFYVLEGLQRAQRAATFEDGKVTVLKVGDAGSSSKEL